MLKLRKIILTIMASATILGLGANLQSLPTVSARHIRTYRVRRHRTYRSRNVRRHRTYRKHQVRRHAAKRYKRTYRRTRKPRQAKRIRRHYRRRTTYTYRPKAGKLSTRNDYKSYQRFSKKQIDYWAKYDDYSPKEFIKYNEISTPTYGQYAKPYLIHGNYMLLTNYQLHKLARDWCHTSSVKKFLKLEATANGDVDPKNKKYWIFNGTYNNGFLNKLGLKTVEKDSVNDINQQRAQAGVGPVTMDPGLQVLAEKHAQMYANQQCYTAHFDQNGNRYEELLSHQYNIPISGNGGENVGMFSEDESWEQPSEAAKQVAYQWGPGHMSNQDNPDWTKVGIGAVPGGLVEDFEDSQPGYVH